MIATYCVRHPRAVLKVSAGNDQDGNATLYVEPCPKCSFPEADGGYCAACGWSLPRPGTPGGWPIHPAGTVAGRLFHH